MQLYLFFFRKEAFYGATFVPHSGKTDRRVQSFSYVTG